MMLTMMMIIMKIMMMMMMTTTMMMMMIRHGECWGEAVMLEGTFQGRESGCNTRWYRFMSSLIKVFHCKNTPKQ